MTDQQHPITPPPELVQQWLGEFFGCMVSGALSDSERYLATQAARWGADTELEACIDFVRRGPWCSEKLRAARRPKPPSLKEQALEITGYPKDFWSEDEVKTIRRALERLQELENND